MQRVFIASLAIATLAIAGYKFLDPTTVKRTPTVGAKVTYSMDGTLTISGMDFTIAGKGAETVTAVDQAKGTYSTESSQSDVTFNGQPAPVPDTPVKQVQKLNGELVSLDAQGPDPGSSTRFQELIEPYFPPAPLNVGDTFSLDIKSAVQGAVPLHVDGKLVALEKIGQWDTAKLDETVKEKTGDSDAASVDDTVWVSLSDGAECKQVVELTNVSFGPAVASAGKITVTRTQ